MKRFIRIVALCAALSFPAVTTVRGQSHPGELRLRVLDPENLAVKSTVELACGGTSWASRLCGCAPNPPIRIGIHNENKEFREDSNDGRVD